MTLKSILVPLNGSASDRPALDLALVMGQPSAAHISALFPMRDPQDAVAYMGMGLGGESLTIGPFIEQIERDNATSHSRARASYEAWRAAHNLVEADRPGPMHQVTIAWQEAIGVPDEIMAQRGATVDLLVETGLHDAELPLEQVMIEAALFGTARPVLVAPPELPPKPFEAAVIAWNGSPEANRAVAAALPLLPNFGRVYVFNRPERHHRAVDPAALIEHLAWHGIDAQPDIVEGPSGKTGEDLLATAARVGASLLVMGAYTHGRLREMLLGGVTEHVLRHAAIPALLTH